MNNMLYHGRFLVDTRPIEHPLNQFGGQIYQWDVMDFDGDQDRSGLATTYDAGWIEGVTAVKAIKRNEMIQ